MCTHTCIHIYVNTELRRRALHVYLFAQKTQGLQIWLLLQYPYKLSLNPLQTKSSLFYLKTHFVRAVNTFLLGYKNQTVMLYGAEVAVCSEVHRKHINTVWTESRIL
jgi:hypothetical protein